jgi:hypothetical protein
MVALPSPLSVSLIPVGSAPDSVSAGTGEPVVVTVVVNAAPTVDVAAFALVMVGGTLSASVSEAPAPRVSQPESVPP